MSTTPRYAEVIVPLAVAGIFTYAIPEDLLGKLNPGKRVLVSFGKRRIYSAVVHSLISESPADFTPKEILEILDDTPHVRPTQLQLWDWMSSYYMCRLGEVMRAALPSGLRPESESRVGVCADFEDDGSMDSHERLLYEVVKDQGEVTIGDLEMTGISERPMKILKKLIEKGAVEINESVRSRLRKRRVSYIQLSPGLNSEDDLHRSLDSLDRAPRQKELLERYLQLAGTDQAGGATLVLRSRLLQRDGDAGALSALLKKGVLEQLAREEMNKRGEDSHPEGSPNELNTEQSRALDSVKEQFKKQQTVLLHGVTSSGKTELYVHLIREQLDLGKQVLYLLPEIALTTQIIERVQRVFGGRVGVFHSRYSDSERVHVYRNLLGLTDEEPYGVVIGVRSAIFLPFSELGLVIIDEEHETTFKQHDPAPRYHARDSAQVLALFHGARVLMGTATPSFESFYNAKNGKYGYAEIQGRFGAVAKPEIVLANTRVATHRKQMVSHFTPQLLKGIKETLEAGEQVILFQNRRGYSHFIMCNECGEIPMCSRCDVSLTYHRISRKLECHYCGYNQNMPDACPSCSSTNMTMKGFGTEKIEDEIALVFEGIRVGRLDTDTARSQKAYERVIGDFAAGRLDILIGTQMVSKGLDFAKVSLVGVMDADSMLHFPDFRAFERSFQLISQVSGRAGRRKKRGKVIIQTSDPEHPVIDQILRDDYDTLFREQMEERELFGYPPFTRMIRISFRHKIPSFLDGATDLVEKELRAIFSSRVYGPQYPPVRKVHDTFIKQIILKIERKASAERAKELLDSVLTKTLNSEVYRSIRISVDVDPF
ncbi:MAG: primosomal protein N' [Bacteroidetes bacterium]|nr:primosomal protein N' [Bacteroidota bacterium]